MSLVTQIIVFLGMCAPFLILGSIVFAIGYDKREQAKNVNEGKG